MNQLIEGFRGFFEEFFKGVNAKGLMSPYNKLYRWSCCWFCVSYLKQFSRT